MSTWSEGDGVLGAAINLGVSLLSSVSLHLGDGEALHAYGGEGLTDVIQLEGLDDSHDDFHVGSLSCSDLRRRRVPRTLTKNRVRVVHPAGTGG